MKFLYCIPLIIISKNLFSVKYAFGQNITRPTEPNDTIENYDSNQPYCFRFTWIGPEFDNTSTVNTTCAQYLDSTRAVGVPCRQPLIVTHDGTPPDIDYLWEYHRRSVLCRQARGQVCAKYSYSFNNEVQNVTYMCTKVFASGEGAITSGCYKQIVNEYEVELCLCESGTGPFKPCNSTTRNLVSILSIMMIVSVKSLVSYLIYS